jgi:NTE family protein
MAPSFAIASDRVEQSGGARGAYEVGVLSALLPALPEDERPTLIVGTSVGALNAAYLASRIDLPVEQLLAGAIEVYRTLEWGEVLAAPWSATELSYLGRYLAGALGIRRARVPALLNPSPLAATVERLIDFGRIGENLAAGRLSAAAVVATSALTSRSVVFHQGGTPPAKRDRGRGIETVLVGRRERMLGV